MILPNISLSTILLINFNSLFRENSFLRTNNQSYKHHAAIGNSKKYLRMNYLVDSKLRYWSSLGAWKSKSGGGVVGVDSDYSEDYASVEKLFKEID